jgi:hypothetical protein
VLATVSSRLGCAIPAHDVGILLAAALAHDINWEPITDKHSRFAAEAKSAGALDAIAAGCGVGVDDRCAMHVLVLATEPYCRADLAALLSLPASEARVPAGESAATLAPLAAEPRLLQLAALLSDADLLSSAGLSRSWSRVQWQRLAREGDHAPGKKAWHHFFEAIVGPDFLSHGGRHFSPNLARIRASMDNLLHTGSLDS